MTVTPHETPSAADLEQIGAMENGLLPAFVVEGQPAARAPLALEMRSTNTPAVSIAFFADGRIRWAKAYGLADVDSGQPATVNTLFQACSISKPVAALGALRLVEQGKLDLDSDVNDKLISWKIPESNHTTGPKVTLRSLLSHTAGLTVHGLDGYAPGLTLPTTVQTLSGSPPANSPPVVSMAAPGERWAYSGGGFTVIQLCMTEVAAEAFPALMRRLVLQPAGMGHSTYEQPLPMAQGAEAATGYHWDGAPLTGRHYLFPEMAAAGLWTTPSDLARFAIAVQDAYRGTADSIVRESTARGMLTPVLNDWGLGLALSPAGQPPGFSHGGDNPGFKARLMAFTTERREGLVIMTNGDGGRYLIPKIVRAVAAAYGWPGGRSEVKRPLALQSAALQVFAGRYRLPGGGEFSITADRDRLSLSMPAALGPNPLALVPESISRFFEASSGLTADFETSGSAPTGRVRLGGFVPNLNLEAKRIGP